MRLTKKRNGKNVIPLLNAVRGIDVPYWRIDRAVDSHSYLSGDAADKLAAYEDAEEQGRLVKVVRCRECYFRGLDGAALPVCTGAMAYCQTPDDWFCAAGKSKDGGQDAE